MATFGARRRTPGLTKLLLSAQYDEADTTTKMYMTGRGEPRAIFQPVYSCHPDTDQLQIELKLEGREFAPPGGHIGVRRAFGERHEFRYSPPGNTGKLPCNFNEAKHSAFVVLLSTSH